MERIISYSSKEQRKGSSLSLTLLSHDLSSQQWIGKKKEEKSFKII